MKETLEEFLKKRIKSMHEEWEASGISGSGYWSGAEDAYKEVLEFITNETRS